MINLLPADIKEDMLYARRNTAMLRWLLASMISLCGVGLIIIGGYLLMNRDINTYTKQVETATNNLKVQKVEDTQKRLEEISANTKLVVQVLSREILFSKLLRQLGAAMPAKSALTGLQIDKVQGGLQLSASAQDFNAATQVQVNLQDPNNKVFEKADINSITCSETSQKLYPCDVVLKALFGKNNQYLYITPTPAGGGTQ